MRVLRAPSFEARIDESLQSEPSTLRRIPSDTIGARQDEHARNLRRRQQLTAHFERNGRHWGTIGNRKSSIINRQSLKGAGYGSS